MVAALVACAPVKTDTQPMGAESVAQILERLVTFRGNFVSDAVPIDWCSVISATHATSADLARIEKIWPNAFTSPTTLCPVKAESARSDALTAEAFYLRSIRTTRDSVFVLGERIKPGRGYLEKYVAGRTARGAFFTTVTLSDFYYIEPLPPPRPRTPSPPLTE